MRTLQEGIYFDCTGCNPPFFSILFLRGEADASAPEIGAAFAVVWETYERLKQGLVDDLPGHPVPAGKLDVLVGYGGDLFDREQASRDQPPALRAWDFDRRSPPAGQTVIDNAGLRYGADIPTNAARCEIAVQLTADSQLAVSRAVVETWKALHDLATAGGRASLRLVGFFSGFLRDDRRSWIDFHDGVSNLRRGDERARVITVKSAADAPWTVGGTYLAYMRIGIDLARWRTLSVAEQELAVGRNKLTGAPLVDVGLGEVPVPAPGCPVAGTTEVVEAGNEAFREPRPTASRLLQSSHVQRANHHARNINDPSSGRIFRQGYDFLESRQSEPFFQAGLNFVSFQDTPERLHRVLARRDWLGGTNFGGDGGSPAALRELLTVEAAGVFVVPPVTAEERWPGAAIFGP